MLALALGLAPFLLIEGGLRLAGWGQSVQQDDPFVGFHQVQPLFVLNDALQQYEIPPARQEYFRPESFAAVKGPREYRIFVLGGSTVQGRPYAIETSFTTWLELALQAADPSREWQVVNCGGVSYASYRLTPILQELLEREPDLFILYTGQNEFLEDRTYARVRDLPASLVALHRVLAHSRLYNVALGLGRQAPWAQRVSGARTVLPTEVDALLDYRGGLEHYQRDDAWTEGVMQHFEFNVDRMAGLAAAQGIPLVLVQPVTNLRDCPPFKFAVDPQLSSAAQQQFAELWRAARDEPDPAQAAETLRAALALDPRHAGAHYYLAKCCEQLGDRDAARRHFLLAKDEDLCPLRIREPMFDALERVAERYEQVRLVDIRPLFESLSEGGIPGDDVMLDHVHPTIEGHQAIALELLRELQDLGVVSPAEGWESRRKAAFRRQMESLDEVYFARGKMRLEGLRLWSQGRSFKVAPGAGRRGPATEVDVK